MVIDVFPDSNGIRMLEYMLVSILYLALLTFCFNLSHVIMMKSVTSRVSSVSLSHTH